VAGKILVNQGDDSITEVEETILEKMGNIFA
jgi:hypothetical protein